MSGALDKYFASPVAADSKLYLTGQSGKIATVRAGPEPELIAVGDLGEECYATPAIAHQGLYVRTREALYRFAQRRISAGKGAGGVCAILSRAIHYASRSTNRLVRLIASAAPVSESWVVRKVPFSRQP